MAPKADRVERNVVCLMGGKDIKNKPPARCQGLSNAPQQSRPFLEGENTKITIDERDQILVIWKRGLQITATAVIDGK